MTSKVSTPLGVTSLALIVLGVIIAIVGIIILLAYQGQEKPWYIWFLIILGLVLGIAGGVMLAIILADNQEKFVI